jgi:predicted transcriptional regulator YheO
MAAEQTLRAERDAIVAALRPVVEGLVATFGPMCEVVLHDYRRPEESVVAVAGEVTGRTVGGAMSEIGMRIVARGDGAGDELNYLTRTRNGRLVKASTMVLRDSTDTVFGALCVNLDVTAVNDAHALLGALAGIGGAGGGGGGGVAGISGTAADVPVTTFGDDIDSVVDAILDAHQLRQNGSWAGLDRAQRLELFRGLDERGVFAVRRAIEQVAGRLGISRASAYSYLAQARAEATQAPDRAATDTTPPGGHA